jgi:ABC-type transporter Mla subunit MlaD
MGLLTKNPAEILGRVDKTLVNGDGVLGRVDGTLSQVNSTLSTVDSTLSEVSGTLTTVESTLGEVQFLLAELQAELKLVQQVPAIAVRVEEIIRWSVPTHAPCARDGATVTRVILNPTRG